MKEDLSEWFNRLYPELELNPDSFFHQLESGAIICKHANNVTQMGRNSMLEQVAANDNGGVGSISSGGGGSGASSNDNSLTHESAAGQRSNITMSSPSPECDEHLHHHHHQQTKTSTSISNNFNHQRQNSNINSNNHASQPLSYRHRHSTANSSISSIATNSSSASSGRQRLSLTGSAILASPVGHQVIDWFRVKMIPYKLDARPGTFFARDNICQFILWCRSLHVRECLLFETDDLVARKNEKSFILCLLEIARIGFKVGMPTPLIIQLEQEIDREIENEAKLQKQLEAQASDDNDEQPATSQPNEASQKEEENNNEDGRLSTSGLLASANDVSQKSNGALCNGAETAKEADKLREMDKNKEEEEESEPDYGPKPQVITNDLLSLHERVSTLSLVVLIAVTESLARGNSPILNGQAQLYFSLELTLFSALSATKLKSRSSAHARAALVDCGALLCESGERGGSFQVSACVELVREGNLLRLRNSVRDPTESHFVAHCGSRQMNLCSFRRYC